MAEIIGACILIACGIISIGWGVYNAVKGKKTLKQLLKEWF